MLAVQLREEPGALFGGQPPGPGRIVRQKEQRHEPKHERQEPFQDKNPAPTRQAEPGDIEQQTRERYTQHAGQGDCGHEPCDCLGPVLRAEPQGEINDYGREEPTLEKAEHKTEAIELVLRFVVKPIDEFRHSPVLRWNLRNPAKEIAGEWCSYRAFESRTNTPQDQDAHENPARPPAHDAHRAWNLENPITPEEEPGAKAEYLPGESGTAQLHGLLQS